MQIKLQVVVLTDTPIPDAEVARVAALVRSRAHVILEDGVARASRPQITQPGVEALILEWGPPPPPPKIVPPGSH